MEIDREELAWAAGFYDGEGCTTSHGRREAHYTATPGMTIAQVDRRPLDRFQAALGLGKVTGPKRPRNGQPFYEWKIFGYSGTVAAVAMLWPFLSEPKRDQAHGRLSEYLQAVHRKVCSKGHELEGDNALRCPRSGIRNRCRICASAGAKKGALNRAHRA